MRLNKFISQSGYCSRRKADELIKAGKIQLNNEICQELGKNIDPKNDQIFINGKSLKPPQNFTYLLLNKPTGYTTTRSDPHAEKTIYSLIPSKFHHLHPVGRLDKESEGLLLLTDDGDFTYQMTHPKHDNEKTYEIKVKGTPSVEQLNYLEKGITITEEIKGEKIQYQTLPCKIISHYSKKSTLLITLHEGRKRQIRKMLQKIGHPVVYLKRISIGKYHLKNLKIGEWEIVKKLS
ncbi:MAG: ribosomal large subunit pseudouridine synthase B [Candidatus Peregrinibacteria bacterium GW2011_GWE2_39_6]|nr:MAG: ribosomal large subunit pseudouridine synthase B [Candidatus Peregrinibacteria bacterium GW2011_GWF2_39_17]KKR23386.1 MAG: ribosomal large subunit pseudouridine synthase B [Candidatus Peregrinibacteria bacterium GW2011_GWE2_39_6]HCW32197.1 pseudouridine synthase [Candidatus Peregrinibacteria bacterium]